MTAPDWISEALFESAIRRSLAKGEALFLREETPLGLYILDSGQIRLTRTDADGRNVILFTAQPGDAFAEASLFSDAYHCDAVASKASLVRLFPKAVVLKALEEQPALAQRFMANLARQVMTLRTRLESRNLRNARMRVLHHLSLEAQGSERIVRIDSDLMALAQEIGLSHESLYRTLASLEAEGAIKRMKGHIKLIAAAV
jgi:CRP-like cAMP-binding protein